MTREIKPATRETLLAIQTALAHLRAARELLVDADAPQAATAVRGAVLLAEGAERHCLHRMDRRQGN
jgi:hypothetical protein